MPMMWTRPRSAGAGIGSVAALRTSAAPGASQSSGRSSAWSAVVLKRRTYVARRPR
jgi:hypothetical protein